VNDKPINDILIVGGGTAGWMTAAYLARRLGSTRPDGVRITLIESSEIGIIGVGEGTFPTIQNTMRTIGVDEARFMREAGAAFKQGIKLRRLEDRAQGRRPQPLLPPVRPAPAAERRPGSGALLADGRGGDIPFSDAVTLQDKVCDAMRGPKRLDDPQYGGPMAYAYHFDAGKLANLLRDVGKATGVKHLLGNVLAVNKAEDGSIASVTTREHGDLTADLYIDCTGFAGALIGEAMGSEWIDKGDTLFVDRALALQVPYDRPDAPVATTTISTAHEAGWTWDIGLPDRRGTGYVYSSRHTTDDRAEQILRGYVGKAGDGLTPRLLKLKVGHRDRHWIKNCVAVGLSGGFLEPLESTGIVLIEAAAYMLARNLPRQGGMEAAARQFNAAMTDRYLRAIDFIKLHYCLSQRTDNSFWTDNADPASIPESLQDHLAMWKHRPPNVFDFPNLHESFKYFNYQYILYGMGFETTGRSGRPRAWRPGPGRLRAGAGGRLRAAASLPDHRALLTEVYTRGFSTKAPDLATAEAAEAPRR
jgi:tryptophan halogenase